MSWLPGYTYRKKKPVNATAAGAQTDYQVKLLVGESSGASGEGIDCENHCQDFPNDIRFTQSDGTTKHDYWVESITGTTPNRLATIQIKVNSIPASGAVDFYMYYGRSNDSSESDGGNTFDDFDDFNLKSNGGWTWWQTPRAIRYVGTYDKTYIGLVTSAGSVQIHSYDHRSKTYDHFTLHHNLEGDDHVAPSILIRDDGKIIVFYTSHYSNTMLWRISSAAEDISAFGSENSFNGGRNGLTYPQPIQLPGESNKIYLFFREMEASDHIWVFRTSVDGGVSFSASSTDLLNFTNVGVYTKPIREGNSKIHFAAMDRISTSSMFDIFYYYYEDGSFYKANGTKICDVADLPMSETDLDMVYDSSEPGNLDSKLYDIALDTSGNPYIVFATLETDVSTYDTHKYRYARWTGAVWVDYAITDAGTYIAPGNFISYSGGLELDKEDPSIVYLSKQVLGQWEIQKFTTPDNGSSWNEIDITSNSSKKNIRPCVVFNHASDLPVLWTWGDYGGPDDFDTTVVANSPDTKWNRRQGMFKFFHSKLRLSGTSGTRGLVDSVSVCSYPKVMELRAKGNGSSQESSHFCIMRQTNNWDYKVDLQGEEFGNKVMFATRNGAGNTTDTTGIAVNSIDNWHNYKIIWGSDKAIVYQDASQLAEHNTDVPTTDLVACFYEGVVSSQYMEIEWVFVRKYCDPEPTWGTSGPEEEVEIKSSASNISAALLLRFGAC